MGRAATYNLKSVTCAIAGIAMGGYADDSAIEIEFPTDLGEHKAGGDGEVVWSATNDDRAIVRIHLLETSPLNNTILGIWRSHEAALASGLPVPDTGFFLFDPISGDEISSRQTFFVKMAQPSKGGRAGNRSWEFMLPNARKRVLLVQFDPT